MLKSLLRSTLPLFLMMSAAPVGAQPDAGMVGTSVIIGTVIDTETKKPLPDVVVTATSPSLRGEQTVVTDAQGNYRIPQLPVGTYTVRFEKESHKPYARPEVPLPPNRTIRVNAEMLSESFTSTETLVGFPPSSTWAGRTRASTSTRSSSGASRWCARWARAVRSASSSPWPSFLRAPGPASTVCPSTVRPRLKMATSLMA